MKRCVAYCSTRNYYPRLIPALKSLYLNVDVDVDRVYLFIEDDEFPEWLPENVEIRNISRQTYFRHDGPNYNSCFSWMAMTKVALPKELPDLDTILYLDVDTIVRGDIDRLFGLNLIDVYAAGVPDKHQPIAGSTYINAGVMPLNLKKLRDDGMCDALIDVLNTNRYQYIEQDAINSLCSGHIRILPPEYNASPRTSLICSPLITHYAGIRDWTGDAVYREYAALTWEEVLHR